MSSEQTVDEYVAQFPEPIRDICNRIRETIRSEAPNAIERISYGIPTYTDGENIIHFGVFRDHIGLYPTGSGVEAFRDRLTAYRTSRGTVRFPLKEPVPYDLIAEITAFRVAQVKNSQS
jgi:uncharacterized protein YdhG (YjbR/CyaY superfamily)